MIDCHNLFAIAVFKLNKCRLTSQKLRSPPISQLPVGETDAVTDMSGVRYQ